MQVTIWFYCIAYALRKRMPRSNRIIGLKKGAKYLPSRIVDAVLDKTVYADKRDVSVELIFCQGGERRDNAGDNDLSVFGGAFEPALDSALRYLPGARVSIYSDRPLSALPEGVEAVVLTPPFDDKDARYGWRFSDWARGVALLESKADIAIYLDSDMAVVSQNFDRLVVLALRFGFCAPMNPRILVKHDAVLGANGSKLCETDPTGGLGFAMNTSPLVANPRDPRAQRLISAYVDELAAHMVRGPLALWRAAWKTGVTPYLLPPQWCVSAGWEGVGDEVVLHLGHRSVAEHYGWCNGAPVAAE